MTHTLEVAQIARSIAKYIGANEELTEAIALGHDLGHTPFGHQGERTLDGLLQEYDLKFNHAIQSFRIVSYLEDYPRFAYGQGLNLTRATRAGILRHSSRYNQISDEECVKIIDLDGQDRCFSCPVTLEEKIVRIADDIAWANHDWDDGVRAGILSYSLLGKEIINRLGCFQGQRINELILDLKANFEKDQELKFSPEKRKLFEELKERLKKYLQRSTIIERSNKEVERQVKTLFMLFMENPVLLPEKTRERRRVYVGNSLNCFQKRHNALVIADHISGMTDDWFAMTYHDLVYFSRMRLREAELIDWIKIKKVKSENSLERNEKEVCIELPENLNPLDLGGEHAFFVYALTEEEHNKKKVGRCKGKAILLSNKEARVLLDDGLEIDPERDVLVWE